MKTITIQNILSSETLRQQEFPVTRNKTYLAHAAVCPLPACVADAISTYVQTVAQAGQFEYLHREAEAETRRLAAGLIGASAEEIAFVPSTSAGLSLVASGLKWEENDNVVIHEGDFPSNIYPWLSLQRKGVQVKLIPRRATGLVTLEDVKKLVDENTKLVSLSTIHYSTGAPIDVDRIGQYLSENGILFCVDAIQSLGIIPFSAKYVDFMAADTHKWLLGQQGIGLLYVRKERQEMLWPILVGWKSVQSEKEFSKISLELPDSARRYEPGVLNAIGIIGLQAALTFIHSIGVSEIAKRLAHLRGILVSGLQKKGYQVLGIPSPDVMTGITSFTHETKNIISVYQQLDKKRIIVSLRDDLFGNKCIRVAPHFYNTEEEIEFLLSNLE